MTVRAEVVSSRGRERVGRTICRPGCLPRGEGTPRTRHGADLGHLEPHVPGGVPGVDIAPLGHPSHVERDRAEVGHGRYGDEAELIPGGDGGGRCARPHLEAAHILAVDIGHAKVALVVLGLAHRGPLPFLGHAVHDELGESVCPGVSWGSVGCGCPVSLTMGFGSSRQKQQRDGLHPVDWRWQHGYWREADVRVSARVGECGFKGRRIQRAPDIASPCESHEARTALSNTGQCLRPRPLALTALQSCAPVWEKPVRTMCHWVVVVCV